MSQMRQEIIDCMSGLTECDEQIISAQFVFPKEFIGFRGHFDNNPILPGICKISAVVVMLEKYYNKAFRLKKWLLRNMLPLSLMLRKSLLFVI